MTPIREFDRRSARVEAMRLDDAMDIRAGYLWLRSHGVRAGIYREELRRRVLRIYGPDGTHLTARLGQWVAHDPGSGEFTVWDHGDEPGQFGREHDETVGVV